MAEHVSETRRNLECEDMKSAIQQMHDSTAALKCFDILRSLFGSTGPCAMPYDKVWPSILFSSSGCAYDKERRAVKRTGRWRKRERGGGRGSEGGGGLVLERMRRVALP